MCSVGNIGSLAGNLFAGATGLLGLGMGIAKNIVPATPPLAQPPVPGTPPSTPQQAPQAESRPLNSAGATQVGSAGSTLLTGAGGVAPSMLTLGRNTLLGQ